MRRIPLAAITFLQGAVACSSYESSENRVDDAGGAQVVEGGVVDTPIAPNDPTRTCVPRPPADWQGPLILFEGSGSPPPQAPPCPSGYRTDTVYDGNAELVAPDSACTCECGAETGATCAAKLALFKEKDCATPCPGTPEAMPSKTCGPLVASGSCFGAKATLTLTPGTCAPKTISKTPGAAPAWTARARICTAAATADAGCAADRVATPTTSLPFTSNTYCIAQSGESECPTSYPRKRVYYASFSDSRDCDCACASGHGGSCGGQITTSDAVDCGYAKQLASDGSCGEVAKSGFGFFTPAIKAGSCAPESHPTGSATPTSPTTVCCTR